LESSIWNELLNLTAKYYFYYIGLKQSGHNNIEHHIFALAQVKLHQNAQVEDESDHFFTQLYTRHGYEETKSKSELEKVDFQAIIITELLAVESLKMLTSMTKAEQIIDLMTNMRQFKHVKVMSALTQNKLLNQIM